MDGAILPILAIVAAAAAVGFAIYELVRHWHTVWNEIKRIADDALGFIKRWWPELLAPITGGMSLLVKFLIDHWQEIKDDAKKAWDDVVAFIKSIPGRIISALSNLGNMLLNLAKAAWNAWLNGMKLQWQIAWTLIVGIPKKILGFLGDAGSLLFHWGKDLIMGLIHGIGSMGGMLDGALKGLISHIPGVGGILSHIPGLAEGGLVTKPTLAVVGEAGPELVIPLRSMPPGAALTGSGITPMPSQPSGGAAATTTNNKVVNFNNTFVTQADPNMIVRELAWLARSPAV